MLNKQLIKDKSFALISLLIFAFLFRQAVQTYETMVVSSFILLFFVVPVFFNRIIRHFFWSKPIIESRLNIFTSTYKDNLTVDLPLDDSYDKFLEVIKETELMIQNSHEKGYQITALTRAGWTTIGENLYFNFTPSGNQTKLQFESVSFKLFDRHTHVKNLHAIITEFENSLTI